MESIKIDESLVDSLTTRLTLIQAVAEIFTVSAEEADLMLEYVQNGHNLRDAYNLVMFSDEECDEDLADLEHQC